MTIPAMGQRIIEADSLSTWQRKFGEYLLYIQCQQDS